MHESLDKTCDKICGNIRSLAVYRQQNIVLDSVSWTVSHQKLDDNLFVLLSSTNMFTVDNTGHVEHVVLTAFSGYSHEQLLR